MARFADAQLAVIRELSGAESRLLQEKMIRIREHGITEGDFTFRFKCALKIAVLAASIVLLVSTGTILIPAVVAAAAAGPAAVIAAFATIEGVAFLMDGVHSIGEISEVIENCFPRQH